MDLMSSQRSDLPHVHTERAMPSTARRVSTARDWHTTSTEICRRPLLQPARSIGSTDAVMTRKRVCITTMRGTTLRRSGVFYRLIRLGRKMTSICTSMFTMTH